MQLQVYTSWQKTSSDTPDFSVVLSWHASTDYTARTTVAACFRADK